MSAKKKNQIEVNPPAPMKPPAELSPEEKANYEEVVAREVNNLLETRGCMMIVVPVYRQTPTGAFETVTTAQIKLKPEIVIKKEA